MPEGAAWVGCPPAALGVGVAPAPCLTTALGEPSGPGVDVDATRVEVGDPTTTRPVGVAATPRIDSVKVEPGEVAVGLEVNRPWVGVGPGLAQAHTANTIMAPARTVAGRMIRPRRNWA
jgi:hypothetical protein